MNYIKEAENKLNYYRTLHQSIEQIDKQIARLVAQAGPRNLSAMVLDDHRIKSGTIDETINILYQIQELQESKDQTRRELAEVDHLLEQISAEPGCEKYGPVLRKWYIEKKTRDTIAEELHYSSVQSVYNIRNAAIRKFAVLLFGISAWRAV